jgi:adenylate kinase
MKKIVDFTGFINERLLPDSQGKIVVIIGPPGSGKGTVSKMLSDKKGMVHISTGDLIRNSEDEELKEIIKGGNFIPDSSMLKMLRKEIKGLDISKGVILDGFPRTIRQAKSLDSMLGKLGLGLSHAIYLDVDEPVAKDRIKERSKKENRSDDKSDSIINKRFEDYKEKTMPLIDFYTRSRKNIDIDASKSPERVYKSIVRKLGI